MSRFHEISRPIEESSIDEPHLARLENLDNIFACVNPARAFQPDSEEPPRARPVARAG